MDLFVLDTVGEQTALEERVVPKTSWRRQQVLTDAPQSTQSNRTQPQQHTTEADDDDDEAHDDDDDDDEDEDDRVCGSIGK